MDPTGRFSVPYDVPVFFTRGAFAASNRILVDALCRIEPERCHKFLAVVDAEVAKAQPNLIADIERYAEAHSNHLQTAGPAVVVPGGEAVKNDIAHVFRLLQRFNDVGLDRQSFVLVVGGGAVLDMVSFAAAIAHRGIRVVRFPTTVLSQADSGIAVKNGINLFGKKNFIGTFVPPFAVINDSGFFESLSWRDRVAGVVEAIKVALLKDATFFEQLEHQAPEILSGDVEVLSAISRRSAELHLTHICTNGDPFELGSARPLDFGHWAAHKLESLTKHRLRHGEAVALGMALDLTYATKAGLLDRRVTERVMQLLDRIGLPLWDDALVSRGSSGEVAVLSGLREFREHLGGELHITLVTDIGRSIEVTEIDLPAMANAIHELALRATGVGIRHSVIASAFSHQ
jgi:3-dehydroquinate synthase